MSQETNKFNIYINGKKYLKVKLGYKSIVRIYNGDELIWKQEK